MASEPYDDDLGNVSASPSDVAYEHGWADGQLVTGGDPWRWLDLACHVIGALALMVIAIALVVRL